MDKPYKNETYRVEICPNGRYLLHNPNYLEQVLVLIPDDVSLSVDELIVDYKKIRYVFEPNENFDWKLISIFPIEFSDLIPYLGESVHIVYNKNKDVVNLYPSSSKSSLSLISTDFKITSRNSFVVSTNEFDMKIENGVISDIDFHIGE